MISAEGKVKPIRPYGGRKTNEERKKIIERSKLIVKKEKFIITFDNITDSDKTLNFFPNPKDI